MSHSIELKWELGDQKLEFGKYLTDHTVMLNDNVSIDAGSSPDYGGSETNINPEPVSYTHLTLPTSDLV